MDTQQAPQGDDLDKALASSFDRVNATSNPQETDGSGVDQALDASFGRVTGANAPQGGDEIDKALENSFNRVAPTPERIDSLRNSANEYLNDSDQLAEQMRESAPLQARVLKTQSDILLSRADLAKRLQQPGLSPADHVRMLAEQQALEAKANAANAGVDALNHPMDQESAAKWQAAEQAARHSGAFDPSVLNSMFGGSSRKEFQQRVTDLSKKYGIDPADVKDILQHRMGMQKDDVSRDVNGQVYLKDSVLALPKDQIIAAVQKSNLPGADKASTVANVDARVDEFKKNFVDNVQKNYPEFWEEQLRTMREHGATEDQIQEASKNTDRMFNTITQDLDKSSSEHFGTGAQGQIGAILPEGGGGPTQEMINQRGGLTAPEYWQQKAALSDQLQGEKLKFLGTSTAELGSAAVGLGKLLTTAAITGPMVPEIFAESTIAKAGTIGSRVMQGVNTAAKALPANMTPAIEAGAHTYKQARAAGKDEGTAAGYALTSVAINAGIMELQSFLTPGMSYTDLATGATRQVMQKAMTDRIRSTIGAAATKFATSNLENVAVMAATAGLDAAAVQYQLNPNMSPADISRSISESASLAWKLGILPSLAHGIGAGVETASHNQDILEQRAQKTFEKTFVPNVVKPVADAAPAAPAAAQAAAEAIEKTVAPEQQGSVVTPTPAPAVPEGYEQFAPPLPPTETVPAKPDTAPRIPVGGENVIPPVEQPAEEPSHAAPTPKVTPAPTPLAPRLPAADHPLNSDEAVALRKQFLRSKNSTRPEERKSGLEKWNGYTEENPLSPGTTFRSDVYKSEGEMMITGGPFKDPATGELRYHAITKGGRSFEPSAAHIDRVISLRGPETATPETPNEQNPQGQGSTAAPTPENAQVEQGKPQAATYQAPDNGPGSIQTATFTDPLTGREVTQYRVQKGVAPSLEDVLTTDESKAHEASRSIFEDFDSKRNKMTAEGVPVEEAKESRLAKVTRLAKNALNNSEFLQRMLGERGKLRLPTNKEMLDRENLRKGFKVGEGVREEGKVGNYDPVHRGEFSEKAIKALADSGDPATDEVNGEAAWKVFQELTDRSGEEGKGSTPDQFVGPTGVESINEFWDKLKEELRAIANPVDHSNPLSPEFEGSPEHIAAYEAKLRKEAEATKDQPATPEQTSQFHEDSQKGKNEYSLGHLEPGDVLEINGSKVDVLETSGSRVVLWSPEYGRQELFKEGENPTVLADKIRYSEAGEPPLPEEHEPQTTQSNAPQERNQQESNLPEHPTGDQGRETTTPGSGNRPAVGGEGKAEEVTPETPGSNEPVELLPGAGQYDQTKEGVAANRAERGAPPLEPHTPMSVDAIAAESKRRVSTLAGREAAYHIATEVANGARQSVSLQESMDCSMLHQSLKAEQKEMLRQHDDFLKNGGDPSSPKMVEILSDMARRNAMMDVLEQTRNKVQTWWGQAGLLSQYVIAEDYSLEGLRSKVLATRGVWDAATQRQCEEVSALHARVEADRARLALEQENASLQRKHDEIQKIYNDLLASMGIVKEGDETAKVRKEVKERSLSKRALDQLDKMAESARQRIAERAKYTSAGVDPTVLFDATVLGTKLLVDGVRAFGKWMTKLRASGFDKLNEDHFRDVWASAQNLYDKLATPGKVSTDQKVESMIRGAQETFAAIPEDPYALAPYARMLMMVAIKDLGLHDMMLANNFVHEQLKQVVPDITLDQSNTIWTGYGKFTEAPEEETPAGIRNRIRQETMGSLKLQNLQDGIFPKKTGAARNKPSALSREYTKQIQELLRRNPDLKSTEGKLTSPVETLKNRLRNQIADYVWAKEKRVMLTLEKSPAEVPAEDQAEIQQLRKSLDEVKKDYQEVMGLTSEKSVEERLEIAMRIAKRNLQRAESDHHLLQAGGELEKPSLHLTSPALESVRAETKKVRSDIRKLQEQRNWETGVHQQRVADRLIQGLTNAGVPKEKIEVDPMVKSVRDALKSKDGSAVDALHQKLTDMGATPEQADKLIDLVRQERDVRAAKDEEWNSSEERLKRALESSKNRETTLAEKLRKARQGEFDAEDKKAYTTPQSDELKASQDRIKLMQEEIDNLERAHKVATGVDTAEKAQAVLDSLDRRAKAELKDSPMRNALLEKVNGYIKEFDVPLEPLRKYLLGSDVDPATVEQIMQKTEEAREVRSREALGVAIRAEIDRSRKRAETLKKRITEGDFAPKARKAPASESKSQELMTPEERDLARRLAENKLAQRRVEKQFKKLQMKWENEQLTPAQNWVRKILRFRRAAVLMGVAVNVKLGASAVMLSVFGHLERALAAGFAQGLKGMSTWHPKLGGLDMTQSSPMWGHYNLKAEFSPYNLVFKNFLKNTHDIWKEGHTDIDELVGTKNEYPGDWMDYPSRIHKIIKNTVFEAEFHRSVEYQMAHAKRIAEAGRLPFDPNDPLLLGPIHVKAYEDANKSIFFGANPLVKAYRGFLKNLAGAKSTTTNREGAKSLLSTAAATAAEYEHPIVTVPLNLLSTILLDYAAPGLVKTGGLLIRELVRGIRSGDLHIDPVASTAILKGLARGSVGTFLCAVGYCNPAAFGGLRQSKDKNALKAGYVNFFGVKIAKLLLHAPGLELLQIGATIRRRIDEDALKPMEWDEDAHKLAHINFWHSVGAGTVESTYDLLQQAPLISDLVKPHQWSGMSKNTVSGVAADLLLRPFIPQFMKEAAQYQDQDAEGNTIRREPHGLADTLKQDLLFFRQSVSPRKK